MKPRTKVRRPLAERLKTALEDGIRHFRGEITLRTTVFKRPDEPPEIDAPTLTAIREQSGMSQAVFARLLNVSPRTVQSWEQGVRTPSHAARRLIQIYSQNPEVVCRSVGMPPITLQGVTVEDGPSGHPRLVVQAATANDERASGTSRERKPPRARARSAR